MKPVRILLIGIGNRAGKYMEWFSSHSNDAVVVAAIDPDREHLDTLGPEIKKFTSLDDFLSSGIKTDAVVITSPDRTHYHYAMAAIAQGWHILLEKPISTSKDECIEIVKAAKESSLIVSVCHVLRHHPYYIKLKELSCNPRLGHILNITHVVNIGLDRMTHSFVRGYFSQAETSSPLVLQKASHDVDILLWLTKEHVSRISSFGSLSLFKAEKAPKNAAKRCLNCPIEKECIFSAVDLYLRRNIWNDGFIPANGETKKDAVMRELESGRFGRCVYYCDNDVVDHQTVLMETTEGTTMELKINGLSKADNRLTHISCSGGTINADGTGIYVQFFDNGESLSFDFSDIIDAPFHAGADFSIVENFLSTINGSESLQGTSASEALESHLICFRAEELRKES